MVTALLIIGLFSIAALTGFLVELIGPDIWDKAGSLAIGMSEQELVKIMGTRFLTRTVDAKQIMQKFPSDEQDRQRLITANERVIEYTFFEKRKFGSQAVSWVGGIYLDESRQRIVFLQTMSGFDDLIPAARYEALLLLAGCIAFPLTLSLWCHRQQKKLGSVEESRGSGGNA